MKIGAFIFATDYAIRADELARELEHRGFDSLFLPEHTHIPVSRVSSYPGGGELRKEYWHTYDSFVALAYAAAATRTLKIATGISLLPQHDTFNAAKAVASLDRMSEGRMLFGIGGGWNVEEMGNHGVAYGTRFKVLRERVLAMKELWTSEEASFEGDFIKFDPVWAWPKPKQSPHPPILLGGEIGGFVPTQAPGEDGDYPKAKMAADGKGCHPLPDAPEGDRKEREEA